MSEEYRRRNSDSRDDRSGGDSRGGGRPYFRGRSGPGGRGRRRRVCQFCADKAESIDYKDVRMLQQYVSRSGAINARRRTGTCAKHQRMLATAVKRARHLALLPFAPDQGR
ncbi:MAG: 30S ribosomal protein S18 [Anaerolineae bacterium]|mgnify:CR=1 FL=1|nr:30S ribosomal protein S18 [Chloroflexota bacterium]